MDPEVQGLQHAATWWDCIFALAPKRPSNAQSAILKSCYDRVGIGTRGFDRQTTKRGCYELDEAEFDKFADEYRAIHAHNIRLSGEAPEFFAEYKVRDLARR